MLFKIPEGIQGIDDAKYSFWNLIYLLPWQRFSHILKYLSKGPPTSWWKYCCQPVPQRNWRLLKTRWTKSDFV